MQVTAQTVASQQAGRQYVIDVTREGAVYDVAAGIDYGRVEVRTSNGDIPLNKFARQRGFSTGNKLLLATSLSDLVGLYLPTLLVSPKQRAMQNHKHAINISL